VLSAAHTETEAHQINLRNVGISVPQRSVRVKKDNPRNHDGEYFTVLATRTCANPRPGSDEIKKACEEGWIGTNGYVRHDGTRQRRALAFQGHVVTESNDTIAEIFVVDLPEDVTVPGTGPLEGTAFLRPTPPKGTTQRRLTFTSNRKFPGIQGPRHWLRTSHDGSRIAFLMKDDSGIVQLWTISPNGGVPVQVSQNPYSIASGFTWNHNDTLIAHVMDGSICVTDVATQKTSRLTPKSDAAAEPRPEACVFSPYGSRIAYVRRVKENGVEANQIFIATLKR
jgi:WD40 repeat protein